MLEKQCWKSCFVGLYLFLTYFEDTMKKVEEEEEG